MKKYLCTSLLIVSSLSVCATDWNYNLGKVTSGQIQLKNKDGSLISMTANAQGNSLMSTAPLVIADGGGTSAYDWTTAFKLQNGDVYAYEATLNHWVAVAQADFDINFSYDETPLSVMQRGAQNGNASTAVTVNAFCGNRQWNIETGGSCTLTCSYSAAPLLFNHSANNYRRTYYGNGTNCWSNSGVQGGSFSYTAAVGVTRNAFVTVNYPFGFGSQSHSRSSTSQDVAYASATESRTVSLSGTYRASVSLGTVGYWVQLDGKDRFLGYASGTGGFTISKMVMADGTTEQAIPNFNLIRTAFSSNWGTYAVPDGRYVLVAGGGDLYLISESATEFIANVPSNPVSLVTNIRKK